MNAALFFQLLTLRIESVGVVTVVVTVVIIVLVVIVELSPKRRIGTAFDFFFNSVENTNGVYFDLKK